MPNQRVVVADLKAGRKPDPKYGKIAKLRSTHNNYLTLPVVFLMLSNHYPLAFATQYNWIIAALVFLMGVTIRHFFNSMHARKGMPWWTWAVTAILFIGIAWLSTAGTEYGSYEESEARALSHREEVLMAAAGFEDVTWAVAGRCAMCHARAPSWPGIRQPPNGILLETPADIARAAREVYLQAGVSHAMPPANITYMEPEERALIRRWYRDAADAAVMGLAMN